MAGITDSAFRLICKKNGADIVYSEMASASALYFKPERTLNLLRFSIEEQPYVVQLFGKTPEHFAKAAQIISKGVPTINYSSKSSPSSPETLTPPAGIDINFGCPAKKVFSHGSGCALMLDPELAKNIIQTVRKNTNLPLSIKVRAGVKGFRLADFLKRIKINSLGIQALMIHGRTYEQGFQGNPDYTAFQEARSIFKGTIIANGGINSLSSGQRMLQASGADGLGIGAGSLGQPFIFLELLCLKNKNPNLSEKKPPWQLVKETALEHARYSHILKGTHGLLESRKHLLWYFKGFPGAKEFRHRITSINSLAEIASLMKEINN
jgi:tRNA-dihydrouridine synthase B